MSSKRKRIAVALLLLSVLSAGCAIKKTSEIATTAEIQNVNGEKPGFSADASPSSLSSSSLSSNDKAFLQAFKASVTQAQTIARELQAILTEMQHNDEFIEAQESINTARQEMLYLWNTMHNDFHPDNADLQKQKNEYESILMVYREGLTLQLEGMKNAEPAKVMEGIKRAQQAEQKVELLVKKLNQ
ncbi:hypothetical protein [Aneurinibacillus sp. UBA3580]|jgi:hypothetical protein|uniref:hypothetical protein n=1 Tax=Aneurinibacillus sp. UBA3580 TaxID=1946041 RepID=UPI00257C1F90|nr:hypothetical protein [Aneurinibacillus sp. UBA3580]